jgi:hypothetical protein
MDDLKRLGSEQLDRPIVAKGVQGASRIGREFTLGESFFDLTGRGA